MKAKVVKKFDGKPDKEIYPRTFNEGDIVEGDLARVAVAQKWAVEVVAKPEKVEKPAKAEK